MLHRILVLLSLGLLVSLCLGLVRRQKLRQCLSFSAYAFAATAFTALILLFPEHYSPEAFLIKQGIYDSLLFAMSLEMAFKVFSTFRGIAQRARALLAVAVTASSIAIAALTPPNPMYADLARFQPGITTGGIWCLVFVALLIVWYQIPVAPFTRAIILGYVPYLVVFVICADFIGRLGWGAIVGINLANALAYNAVAGYLAYAAWRKD